MLKSLLFTVVPVATLTAVSLAPSSSAQSSNPAIYSTAFDSLDGWVYISGGFQWWNVDATPTTPGPNASYAPPSGWLPYVSAPSSMNYNDGVDFGTGFSNSGVIESPAIDLSAATEVPVLEFMASAWMEDECGWDRLRVDIVSESGDTLLLREDLCDLFGPWRPYRITLDRSWGIVRIRLDFDTIDFWFNEDMGVFVDDLRILDSCSVDPAIPCSENFSFCFGDGSGTACPCENESVVGEGRGCVNSSGTGARLVASGVPEVMNDTLRFHLEGAPPSSFAFLVSADNALPMTAPGNGNQDFDGLRCVGGNLFRHGSRAVNSNGTAGLTTPGWGPPDNPNGGIAAQYGFSPGQTRYFQVFVRDHADQMCATGGNRSNGVKVTFQ